VSVKALMVGVKKIKIEKKNIFHRQLMLWKEIGIAIIIGIIFTVCPFNKDKSEISFFILYLGYFLFFLALLFSLWLLIEIISPKQNSIQCKFKSIRRIPPWIGIMGYKLVFVRNKRTIKFYISMKDRNLDFNIKLIRFLEKDESYRIKYLTKSKTIIEIDNNTFPEIEDIRLSKSVGKNG